MGAKTSISMATGSVLEELVCLILSVGLLVGYHIYWIHRTSRDSQERRSLTTRGTMQQIRDSWVRQFLAQPVSTVGLNTLRNYIKGITAYKQSSLLICAASCGYVVNVKIQHREV